MLVLSKYEVNKKCSFFVGIDLVDETTDGIEVVGEKDSYVGLVKLCLPMLIAENVLLWLIR